jgi:hypothetical protein
MKNQQYIVLAMAAAAVYLIVRGAGAGTRASANEFVPNLRTSSIDPAEWTSSNIGNDITNNYAAYAYGRAGL